MTVLGPSIIVSELPVIITREITGASETIIIQGGTNLAMQINGTYRVFL